MIRRKEGDNTFRIQFAETHHSVENCGRRTLVARLNDRSRGWHSGNVIGIKRLMRPRQHQQSPPSRNQSGNASLGLLQERLFPHNGAKLLRPIVTCDSARKWKQSLPVASGQNRGPAVTARIVAIDFHCQYLSASQRSKRSIAMN